MSRVTNKLIVFFLLAISGTAFATKSDCISVLAESFHLTDRDRSVTEKSEMRFLPLFRSEVLSLASRYLWIKLDIDTTRCADNVIVSIPSREVTSVNFWQYSDRGLIKQDSYKAFSDLRRYYPLRHSPRFKLSTKRAKISTVYMKIYTDRKIEMQYSITTETTAISEELKSQVYFLLFLGLAIGLTCYNFYLYLTTQEKVYLFFAAYAVSVILGTTINEGNADLFFPISGSWYYYLNLVVASAIFFKLNCVRTLLPLQVQAPGLDRLVKKASYSCYFIFIASLWPPAGAFLDGYMAAYVAVTTALCAYAAAVSYRREFKPARILIVAWTSTFFVVGLRFLSQLGQVENSFFTIHAYKIGLTVELVLLAVVLADKINYLQAELSRLNSGLEQKINNRTKQLKEANKKAQESQAHIVEQEKFSALGRIADALAHEVNTPLMIIRTGASILKKNSETISAEMIERRSEQVERAVDKIEKITKAITVAYLNPLTNKDKKQVDISNYVLSIVELHRGLCIQHEIDLKTNIPDQMMIPGNPLHLADVLSELISTSIEATGSSVEATGSMTSRWIEIDLSRKKQDIIIIIKDSANTENDAIRREVFSEQSELHPKLINGSKAKSLAIASHVVKSFGGSLKFVQNTFYTQATIKFPADLKKQNNGEAA